MCRGISIQNKKSMDFQLYQVNQINQLLNSLRLQDFSRDTCHRKQSISTSSPPREDTEMLEEQFGKIEISSPNPYYQRDIALLQIPLNINDHYRVHWQLRDNSPPSILMSQRFPRLEGYLKEYATLMGEKDLGMGLIKIYPHNFALLSQRRYRTGQKLLQIGGQWIIGDRLFANTRIRRYLGTLQSLIQRGEQIFDIQKIVNLTNNEQITKSHKLDIHRAINEGLNDESVLYLFELKFVMGIETAQPSYNRIEQAQWLYFQLLPKSFDYIPIYHPSIVGRHHEMLSERIQDQHSYFTFRFSRLCNLLQGTYIKKQFDFQTFLSTFYPTDIGFYQRYLNALSFQNYIWCQICERSRIINRQNNDKFSQRKFSDSDIDEQLVGKKAFFPIIDLLHHSQKHANVEWSYERGVLTLYAKRQIKCGDILYIRYRGELSIQTQYLCFGFVEVDSESYLDIFFKNIEVVIDIAEIISQRKFKSQRRELIRLLAEEYNLDFILEFRSDHLKRHNGMKLIHSQAQICLDRLIKEADKICISRFGAKYACKDEKSKLTKQTELKKIKHKLQEQIYEVLKESIRSKHNCLEQIYKQIQMLRSQGGKFACNKQYNLMCLYTLTVLEIRELVTIIK